MVDSDWHGGGPAFEIDLAGRHWRLDPQGATPGLSGAAGHILGLRQLATAGRPADGSFGPDSLVAVERHRGAIQATYAPAGRPGLIVRASWRPTAGRDGFDLEVQVTATSAGVFRRLEVAVESRWPSPTAGSLCYRVLPRDATAAASSYDGREPPEVLRALTTLPTPDDATRPMPPLLRREPGPGGRATYLEMVHPADCARRVLATTGADDAEVASIRYGLFGLDLEKGVVLRGRLRGIRLASEPTGDEVRHLHEAFLHEPPALGP